MKRIMIGLATIVTLAALGRYFYSVHSDERREPPKPHQVTLTWNAAPRAKNYNIYRRRYRDETFTKLASSQAPAYVDTTVIAEEIYCYAVSAVDTKDRESVKSRETCITIPWP